MADQPEEKKRFAFHSMKGIRNSVLPYAFRWGAGLGTVAAPASLAVAEIAGEIKAKASASEHNPNLYTPTSKDFASRDTVPEFDNYYILDSGNKLSADYPGITEDEHGTLEISYTFKPNKKAMSVMPDSIHHEGEKDIGELSDEGKKLFLEQFEQISDTLNLRFVEATNPDSAYFTFVAGDLSNYYDNERGVTGVGGYAQYPNKNGSLVMMDRENMKNTGWAQVATTHELGHGLGLSHPHAESGKAFVLPKKTDNVNATVMSYEASTEQSVGGMMAARMLVGRAPKGFQFYDLAVLASKYGWSRHLAKEQRYVLGQLPEVHTLIGGSEYTIWQVDTAAGPSFIDMNNGVKHPSSVGTAFYWSYFPVDRVEALNNEDNIFIGNGQPNVIIDGDGSSVFSMGDYYNFEADSLYTGKGKDVIQVGRYTSNVVIMDYDPSKDRIEYDEKYISDYKVRRKKGGSTVKFKDEKGRTICTIDLPTAEPKQVGKIVPAEGRIVTPFANRMTAVEPGQDKYINSQAGRWRIFQFPDSVKVEDIAISIKDDETHWKFTGEKGEDLGTVSARGVRDISKCYYLGLDQHGMQIANHSDKVRYEGIVPLPDGSTLQTDITGVNIRNYLNYHREASPVVTSGETAIFGKGNFDIGLNEKSYVHRDEGSIVINHLYKKSAINQLNSDSDTLKFMANSVQVVDCGGQRAAIFTLYEDNSIADAIYINQVEGDLKDFKIKSLEHDSLLNIEVKPISALDSKLQQQVQKGMEWAAKRQEAAHILLQQPPPIWQQRIQSDKPATRHR